MCYLNIFHTYELLEQAIYEYIELYNTKKLQKKLEDMTPIEHRNHTLTTYFLIIYHLYLTESRSLL